MTKNFAVYRQGESLQAIDITAISSAADVDVLTQCRNWFGIAAETSGEAIRQCRENGYPKADTPVGFGGPRLTNDM